MTFIKTIPPEEAEGRLKTLYDRIKGPDGRVDSIMMAHSLRPHSMEGHMALYKNVLHHNANATPKWFLETIGVYVSMLNGCAYCVEHHYAGLSRLLGDGARAGKINHALLDAAANGAFASGVFTEKETEALQYAGVLTTSPSKVSRKHIDALRDAGWDDEAILEINQVAAYFSYANRTVLGLGVTTDGEIPGLSPNNSDDENDWGHQ